MSQPGADKPRSPVKPIATSHAVVAFLPLTYRSTLRSLVYRVPAGVRWNLDEIAHTRFRWAQGRHRLGNLGRLLGDEIAGAGDVLVQGDFA